MPVTVAVVDYGLGNMLSVHRMLEHCGARPYAAHTPEDIAKAQYLVLPGVGAFALGMQGLASRNLIEPLKAFADSGRPLLGICLGMQLFLTLGEEFGKHAGLDILPGVTRAIPTHNEQGKTVKLPHIGWDALLLDRAGQSWAGSILRDVRDGDFVYFVHSYYADIENHKHCVALCQYDMIPLTAVIEAGNIHGCQFHPEKSGFVGVKIMKAFLSI